MKILVACAMSAMALGATAAVARVQQVEHQARPVYNSGTGVMPAGAQEAMPRASRRIARQEMRGVGFSPVMFSLFTPVQLPGEDFDVGGFRLDLLWGTCCNFDGLDIGVVGLAKNHANGLCVNVVTYAGGDGIGLDVGGVNYFGGDFIGAQIGLANWVESGDLVQIGVLNRAYDARGHQIGLVNSAQHFEGVQIGLVNVISSSSLPFMPIVNWYW